MTRRANYVSDEQLIEGIRVGGQQRSRLEGLLYDQYAYLIRHGSRKHRLQPDECASAYSDTILSVISHLANDLFDGRSTLKTYLYQIFTHKCIDFMRSKLTNRNRVHQTLALDETMLTLPDPVRSVVDQLSTNYDVDELQRRIQGLNARGQALLLAWGAGYSDQEIAQQLGYRSAAVAKTTRLRCLQQLRQLYGRGK